MNIEEMIIDSIKFSLKGKIDFILFGLLLWSLNLIFYLSDYSILGYLFLFIWFIFAFIESGFLANIIENTIWNVDIYPKFKNIKNLIWKGFKESLILVIYSLIPVFILSILFFDLAIFPIDGLTIILSIIFFISLFFSLIMVQGAIIHYEYNHSKFKTAFEFKTILLKLKNMGLSRFIGSFSMVLLITLIVEPFVSIFFENSHPLIYMVIEFTILPFLAIFSARFMGLIGRYHFK